MRGPGHAEVPDDGRGSAATATAKSCMRREPGWRKSEGGVEGDPWVEADNCHQNLVNQFEVTLPDFD